MGVTVTAPNNGSDYVEFKNQAGTSLAKVGGYDDGSSNGHIEIYTTASGTPTERVRIDNAGNVGIGTSSPSSNAGYGGLTLNGTSGSLFDLRVNNSNTFRFGSIATENLLQGLSNVPMTFYINNAERMRINSSGNLLVGTTTGSGILVVNGKEGVNFGYGFNIQRNGASSANYEFVVGGDNKLYLGYAASGTPAAVGNFATNGTYTATSDVRKKKDISYEFGGIDIVSALKPAMGRMNEDDESHPLRPFLIAQDTQPVLPSVVSSLDPDPEATDPILGIDYASVVPVLVKAIQELKAEVDDLKAQLEAK